MNFRSVLKYRSLVNNGIHFLFLLDCCVGTIIKTTTHKMSYLRYKKKPEQRLNLTNFRYVVGSNCAGAFFFSYSSVFLKNQSVKENPTALSFISFVDILQIIGKVLIDSMEN